MKNKLSTIVGATLIFTCGVVVNSLITTKVVGSTAIRAETVGKALTTPDIYSTKEHPMTLGAFSMSLSVKDLNASREFYESLGFSSFGGTANSKYLIMKNGNALIGLFQGMFQGNILTFNPGWDENAKNLEHFDDVRDIQRHLESLKLELISKAEEGSTGPASIMLKDPDGNLILIDQHR